MNPPPARPSTGSMTWTHPTLATRLGLLASLYLAQGLPYGFFTQALPVVMREQGMSLAAIGLSALLYLPWALKFIWAPLLDRTPASRFGRRRQWIVPLQAIAVLSLLALAAHAPTDGIGALVTLILVINFVAATQDIATDGLAVSLLRPAERGLGNGVQVAGYRVGMIIGGGALLVVFHHGGWSVTFLLAAGLMALASLPILRWREPPSAAPAADAPAIGLGAALRRPGMAIWLGVLLAYKFGDAIGGQMIRPFLVDRGIGIDTIGWLLGGGGFTAGLLGAVAGGWSAGRWGRRRTVALFGACQALAVGAYALPALGLELGDGLYAICLLDEFAGGLATVALFTAMMDRCRPAAGGTDYTLQASAVVLSTGIAASLSGWIAQGLGYGGMFALSGGLSLLGAAFAGWVMQRPSGGQGSTADL